MRSNTTGCLRSASRRRNLRKTQSADALNGYPTRNVQFACDERGQIKHDEQIIKRHKDKSVIWWNKDEIEDIRDTCWVIVDNAKSTSHGKTTPIGDEETRGLERYLMPTRVVTAQEHRRLILEVYRIFAQDEDEAAVSKKAAKAVSRQAQKVAYLTAKSDTREALKAALT